MDEVRCQWLLQESVNAFLEKNQESAHCGLDAARDFRGTRESISSHLSICMYFEILIFDRHATERAASRRLLKATIQNGRVLASYEKQKVQNDFLRSM